MYQRWEKYFGTSVTKLEPNTDLIKITKRTYNESDVIDGSDN